jgi:hypothetical protein
MSLTRSLAHLKRGITEKKWAEARQWAGGPSRKKYRMPNSQRPDGTVTGSTKRLVSRLYQVKTGHCHTGRISPMGEGPPQCSVLVVPVPDADEGPRLQGVPRMEGAAEDTVGGDAEEDGEEEEPVDGPGSASRWEMRAGGADFLSSPDVGKLVPPLEEDDARSEVSEWELWERRARQEEREAEVEALGVVDEMGAGEELLLFLPTPSFMASAGED